MKASTVLMLLTVCAGGLARGGDGFSWIGAYWAPGGSSFTADAHYWEGGELPSGDGVGYYLGTQSIDLNFSSAISFRGLDFGEVKVSNGKPSLKGNNLTLVGDAFIAGTGSGRNDGITGFGDIGVVSGVIHGTGENSFSKRDIGTLTVNTRFADFGTIVAGGGRLSSSANGEQLFATGSPTFAVRGGIFRWAPSLAADVAGTASLAATTYGAGVGAISWTKGEGASATLTLASLTSEGAGSTLWIDNAGGSAALGETEKLLVSTPPELVNGLLDPGIVVRDTSVESWPISFTTYDAAKGVVPYPAASMKDLLAEDVSATDVAVVTATNTLETSKRVAALVVENSAGLTISDDVTLTVGDGVATHPAGVIFNLRNPMGGDTPYKFEGAGTLAFGNSPGHIWMSSPTLTGWGGNRRLYLRTKITGENGVTLASASRGDAALSTGIFNANDTSFQWNGPTRVTGCILWIESSACLPAGDIYVTEGTGWGGQLRFGTGGWTFNQNFFLSGRGTYGDGVGALQFQGTGTTTFAGELTLLDDTAIAFEKPAQSRLVFRKGIKGPGGLRLNQGGNYTFQGTNTFNTLFTKGATAITIGGAATLGSGLVWNKSGAMSLAFDRRTDVLEVTNAFRVAEGASLTATFDNADVAFMKDVPFKDLKLGNFSTLQVGGVLAADTVHGVGARDTKLGSYGQDEIVAASNDAELRVGASADGVLALPLSDGAGKLSLTKTGAGTLELPPVPRAYTGATSVREGTLKLDAHPLASPSLLYWMDASRAEDFEKDAETGVITKWNSCGGSADVSFSVIAGTPTWGTAEKVNGRDVVTTKKVDGVEDHLRADKTLEQRTVFIVYRLNQIVNMGGIFGGTCNSGVDYGVRTGSSATSGWDANSSHYCFNTTGWIRRDGKNGGAVDQGVPHILTLVHDRDNWAPNVTWGKNTYGCTFQARLGGYMGGRNYDGDYCEIIAFDRVLSESEMRVVENYLSEKWLDKTIWDDLAKPAALPSETVLTVDAGATLDLNGCSVTVASLTGNGTITNSSATAATLTVTGGGAFGGRVGGATTLAMGGSFTMGTDLLMPPTADLAYWCDAGKRETILLNDSGSVTSWVCCASASASALVSTGTLSSGGEN